MRPGAGRVSALLGDYAHIQSYACRVYSGRQVGIVYSAVVPHIWERFGQARIQRTLTEALVGIGDAELGKAERRGNWERGEWNLEGVVIGTGAVGPFNLRDNLVPRLAILG